ncbi:hypothetical protein TSTA_067850 [Talaromyces stipitatus ATCC 10500]|uniref:GPI inositol-deacylase winged helix domain-containing protein n=1 Tax=Talaromyces stipitatus (strain ATCC 10500 / CBS 375.48 / QM 6759 / NRRL 1006) TaxID=441959 RepID=B8LYJ8_TALSN|nr:uncharacterized protein TSTA_067850 [Talaromyces stipitatus ATCC 10500]EED23356.1 hypothetical protein TSTA_067850 [Talaromyces stipitatus ATCC 10500]
MCIMDALDECEEGKREFLIKKTTNFHLDSKNAADQQPKLKFFLTSRPYYDIQFQFHLLIQEVLTIHLSGDEESANISNSTNGQRTKGRLKKPVSELPRSVMKAYDLILKKSRDKKLARDLLRIIFAARTPLTLKEMSVALALAGDLSYSSYEDMDLKTRMSLDKGSAISNFVYLIHQTAKEYLVEKGNEDKGDRKHSFCPQESETLIAGVCISLLSFECFAKDPIPVEEDKMSGISSFDQGRSIQIPVSYLESHPFLEYTTMYWTDHCKSSGLESQESWQSRITTLCEARSLVFQRWFAIYRYTIDKHLPKEMTSLNSEAKFGITNILRRFLDQGEDPNERVSQQATPLQRVTFRSFEATMILVEAGAGVNAVGWETPFFTEVDDHGNERQVGTVCGTPLCMAVYGDNPDIVSYLMQNGASVDLQSTDDEAPMDIVLPMLQSRDNASKTLQILLDHGADASC